MRQTIPLTVLRSSANPSVCSPCGGKCCQTMPGCVFPSDLDSQLRPEVVADKVLALLESGRYALDWWEGNPFSDHACSGRAYFLRPAIRGSEGRWTDDSWGGTCTFHSAQGCALEEPQRPLECRALVPSPHGACYKPEGWEAGGRRLAAQAWWEYQETLQMFSELYWETVEVRNQYEGHL